MVKTKSWNEFRKLWRADRVVALSGSVKLALSGKLVASARTLLYLALDGTGSGRVRETEGRKVRIRLASQNPEGQARVCLHATKVTRGYPVRDPELPPMLERSNAEDWPTIMPKAVRRGHASGEGHRARRRSRWIWGIAEEHFPGALQIVDLITPET